MKKQKTFIIAASMLLLVLLIGGVTFAAFNYDNTEIASPNNINSGHISMTYIEPSNEYIIKDALPMNDSEGMVSNNYFEFSVSTNAVTNENDDRGVSIPYEITITSSEDSTLLPSQVKMYLTEIEGDKEIVNTNPTLLSNLSSSIYKEEGTKVGFNIHLHRNASEGVTKKYRLRAWIDKDVDVSNWDTVGKYQFKFRVNVNGEATYQGYETDSSCFDYRKVKSVDKIYYEINGYDFNKCDGKNIVVPSTINEEVKYKEIMSVTMISEAEYISNYKDRYFTNQCSGYDNLSACLTGKGVSETSLETTAKSEYAAIKGQIGDTSVYTGQNFYDYEKYLEQTGLLANGTLVVELGSETTKITPIPVGSIVSFTNTTVAAVSNKNTKNNVNNLNNTKNNVNATTIEDEAATASEELNYINNIIIPTNIYIHAGAFLNTRIANAINRTGDFPKECFTLSVNGEEAEIYQYNCKGIDNPTLPISKDGIPVTIVGTDAFNSAGLTKINIPEGIKLIEQSGFANNALVKIDIPDTVTKIGKGAFYNNKLANVNLGGGIAEIEESAFSSNQIKNVNFPEGLKTIGYSAFAYNDLGDLIIPSTVTEIGRMAFYKNTGYNKNINTITNKTGKAFTWNAIIINGNSEEFETGTVKLENIKVEIIK